MGSKVSQNNQIIWRSASSSSSLLKLEQSNRRSLVLAQISVDRGEERHLYQPTCLSIYPPTYLLIYLPTYLSIYYLPTYLSIYLHTYLPNYLNCNEPFTLATIKCGNAMGYQLCIQCSSGFGTS